MFNSLMFNVNHGSVNLREINSSDKNKDYKTIVSIFWPWSLLVKKTGHVNHVGLSNSEAKWKDVF